MEVVGIVTFLSVAMICVTVMRLVEGSREWREQERREREKS